MASNTTEESLQTALDILKKVSGVSDEFRSRSTLSSRSQHRAETGTAHAAVGGCMSTRDVADTWVIYSPNESALLDGAGFWSNTLGWVELDQATRFSTELTCSVALPLATGHDARFVILCEASRHYS